MFVIELKIDRLLDMLVESAAEAEKYREMFPLTIVFVERKVLRYIPAPTGCIFWTSVNKYSSLTWQSYKPHTQLIPSPCPFLYLHTTHLSTLFITLQYTFSPIYSFHSHTLTPRPSYQFYSFFICAIYSYSLKHTHKRGMSV